MPMRALYLRLRATHPADEDAATSRETAALVQSLAEELEADGALARTGGGTGLEIVYPYDEERPDAELADDWQERALAELLFWLRARLADASLELTILEERPVVFEPALYHAS